MSKSQPQIPSTDKTTNVNVALSRDPTLDEMEGMLQIAAHDVGLVFSHITTLSQKRYPGNRHWHLKQGLKERGCLDVTYWPDGRLMWISIRHYEPEWVHELGPTLATTVEALVTAAA